MLAPSSPEVTATGYTLRRLCPEDAAGVARIVEQVYGDTYYPRDLYDPAKILSVNEAGKLVSIVALDATRQVVGHYALERPHLGAVAEASDAIVLPEHRHHHLMEEMRLLLREEAIRLGLTGLVGYPVTNHLFSQKAEEHFGAHPCGVALGLWPSSFHNMPEALSQRMSFVIYFKSLRARERVVHVNTRHHEICSQIYRRFDVTVELQEGAAAEGMGDVQVEYEAAVQAGTIRVRRVGADTAAAIGRARQELCGGSGARALTLELPLAQPGTAAVCQAAEDEGFFFSGVGPAFSADGDTLLLQYLVDDMDESLVQIDSPFARDLLAYVGRERARAAR